MYRRIISLLLLTFSVQLFYPDFKAQDIEPIVTDRPDITESALTLPLNYLQIETGFLREAISIDSDHNIINYNFFNTLVRYGVLSSLELRVAAKYKYQEIDTEKIAGFTGIFFGTKVQIVKEKKDIPDIALLTHLILPIGSEEIKPAGVEPEVIFSVAHDLSSDFSLGYNLGGGWNSADEIINYFYSIAAGTSITEKLGSFIEIFGDISSAIKPEYYIDGGFSWLLKENIQLDISIGTLINKPSDFWFVNTGFSIRFPQ